MRTHLVFLALALVLASSAIAQEIQMSEAAGNTPSHLTNQNTGPFQTQDWGAQDRVEAEGAYALHRVTFESQDVTVVGNLFVPGGSQGRRPALVVIGPVGYVKEQAPIQYASRLARDGFVTLVFDPRHHGESGGEPRRLESGRAKTDDLKAALDYLSQRAEVDPEQLFVVGVCQGVNWAMQATIDDARVRGLAMVAGNYLTPAFAKLYLGSEERVGERLAKAAAARERFERTGEVEYIPVVSETDPDALLTPEVIRQFYGRWADRGAFWTFHGLWENRIARMSEAEVWGGRAQEVIKGLTTPVLMVHANRAANGPVEPKQLFETIPAVQKRLVWLGNENQMQFYEDPVTIDRVVQHIAHFFRERIPGGRGGE